MIYQLPVPQTREAILERIRIDKAVDKTTLKHFIRYSDEFYRYKMKLEERKTIFESTVPRFVYELENNLLPELIKESK